MQMGSDQSAAFMRALRNGSVMQIIFPDGSEPMWTGGLSGSGRAINAFNDCRMQLEPGLPTQPYSTGPAPSYAPGPTQPFGGPAPLPPLRPTY